MWQLLRACKGVPLWWSIAPALSIQQSERQNARSSSGCHRHSALHVVFDPTAVEDRPWPLAPHMRCLQIELVANNSTDMEKWDGWVRSRVRHLVGAPPTSPAVLLLALFSPAFSGMGMEHGVLLKCGAGRSERQRLHAWLREERSLPNHLIPHCNVRCAGARAGGACQRASLPRVQVCALR